jgi:hypothetical protein
MKKLFILTLLALFAVSLVPDLVVAQPKTNRVIDLKWVTPGVSDSAQKAVKNGLVAYSAPFVLPDSSARGGGAYFSLWTTGDTIKAKVDAEFGIYDYAAGAYVWFPTGVTVDSLTNLYHTGASKNPSGDALNWRRPRGETHARLKVTVGASIKLFTATGTGPSDYYLRGKIIIPKF